MRIPLPVRVCFWFVFSLSLIGLLVGMLNVMNPEAVHIPFGPNGESAEGLDGIIASVASSAVAGLFLGVPAGLLTWAVLGTGKTKGIRAQHKRPPRVD